MEKITFTREVYTYHIDFAGHVSNIVYIQWMEVGRLKLLKAAGMPVEELLRKGTLLPTLAATTIRYQRQLFLGDLVTIEVWLTALKHASATMSFRFFNRRLEPVARGEQTGLFIDPASHSPVRLADDDRRRFLPFLEKD